MPSTTSLLFKGVKFAIGSDVPEIDFNVLVAYIEHYGGEVADYTCQDPVTLIITCNYDFKSVNASLNYILPHYIDDCVKYGVTLPMDEYLLPDAKLLSHSDNPVTTDSLQKMIPEVMVPMLNSSSDNLELGNYLAGKSVYFHVPSPKSPEYDTAISSLSDVLLLNNVNVVSNTQADIDIVVSLVEDSFTDLQKSRGSIVLSPFLLVSQIQQASSKSYNSRWTLSPLLREPRKIVKSLKNHVICITNYVGCARDLIKLMISLTGGSYSSVMDRSVTVLVSSCQFGKKYDAAQSWGINAVNHLWLEDCLLLGRLQPFTRQRYAVGWNPISLNLLVGREYCYSASTIESTPVPQVDTAPTADAVKQQKIVECKVGPSAIINQEVPIQVNTTKAKVDSAQQQNVIQRKLNDDIDYDDNKRDKSRKRRARTDSVSTVSILEIKDVVAGGNQKQDYDLDEIRRRQSLSSTVKKARISGSTQIPSAHKSVDDFESDNLAIRDENASSALQNANVIKNQEQKVFMSNLKPIKVAFTGIKRPAELIPKMTELNLLETSNVCEASHLITNRIARTEKFMCAVACCSYIVTLNWLEDSIKKKQIQDENFYALKDVESEKALNFSLTHALNQAKQKKVFTGLTFYPTPKVVPPFKTLKTIIENHGGTLIDPHQVAIESLDINSTVISCQEDEKLWTQLRQRGFTVYYSELVLCAAITQNLDNKTYKITSK
ncbi:hypothetical protein MP228_011566 [Amoeboaphelidium protococcarum]|nr:hypothetical protein MP228_011566 [Amoeboaphelidium protococcarum]